MYNNGVIDEKRIEEYRKIRALTYDNVEIHFIAGLKNRLPIDLTFKDMTVIYFINEQFKSHRNTVLEIASSLSMQKNTFSNRLKRLEKLELIVRKPHPTDHRKAFIQLSSHGEYYLKEYTRIVNGFIRFLKKAFPPLERIKLAQAMVKASNAITKKDPIKLNLIKPSGLKGQMREVLSRIYDDTVKEEEVHIEARNLNLSIMELRVLIEVYLHPDGCTQKQITQTFKVTQSTMVSLMKRLEKESFLIKTPDQIDKRILKLTLTPQGIIEAEQFIIHRLKTIDTTILHPLSPQEQKRIYKGFKTLKDYADSLS